MGWNTKVYQAEEYCDAITTGDYLVCYYGGIIKVIEANSSPHTEEDLFVEQMRKKGFTDCYIKHLKVLHEKYPKWIFEARSAR